MARFIRFLLSVIVGAVVGFVIMLINIGLFRLLCCGLVAFLMGGFVYHAAAGLKGLNTALAVVSALAGFFLYLLLTGYLDENAKTMLFPLIIFMAPYCLTAWLLFEGGAVAEEEKEKQE